MWDAEGTRYLDLVQSYGAIIAGHAHPRIVEAITLAAADGTSYGAPTAREVKLAEVITARVPSCDQIRLVNSGTEATMTAIRVARGFTGRPKVLKFAGNYHGHGDALLAAGGSGVATLGLSGSAGVTAQAVSQTIVAPYNVVPEVGDDVACVIVEPVAANMGLVAPATRVPRGPSGRVRRRRRPPDLRRGDHGLPRGARRRPGAVRGAPRPHLLRQGDRRRPADRRLRRPGRRDGRPRAARARVPGGHAVGEPAGDRRRPGRAGPARARGLRAARGAGDVRLAAGLTEVFAAAGIPALVPTVGPLVGLHLSTTPAVDYDTAKTTDEAAYAKVFHALLDQGVALAPGPYEIAFPGLAHTDDVLDEILTRTDDRPPLVSDAVSPDSPPVQTREKRLSSCRGRGGRGWPPPCRRARPGRARRAAAGWP